VHHNECFEFRPDSAQYSIAAWCIVFMLGVAVQTGANEAVACIYGAWSLLYNFPSVEP
jgi:hypothetical protein